MKTIRAYFFVLGFWAGFANALTIAPFSLPTGVGMTILNDHEQNQKFRKDKDNQGIRREENLSLRQFIHVPEDQRLTDHDEWLLIYHVHENTTDGAGSRGFMQYKKGRNAKLKVRFYADGNELVMTSFKGEPLDLTEFQRETVEEFAKKTSLFYRFDELINHGDWHAGAEEKLATDVANEKFNASEATLTLTKVMTRWERQLAEFRLDLKYESGLACKMFYWVLPDLGRPVYTSINCAVDKLNDGVQVYHRDYSSKAYTYTDISISELSLRPMLAQQPKGKVLDLAFSDNTGQLAFLTQDYETDTNWLTFWDLEQRKVIHSRRQAGESLLLTEDEEVLFVIGEQRMHQGWLKIDKSYKSFGHAVDGNMEADKHVIDSALRASYPVTLNASGEIEVWNLGYNQLIANFPVSVHKAECLSMNKTGQLITANSAGEFALHQLTLRAHCDKPIEQGYCEVVEADFVEAESVFNVDLDIDADKGLKEISVHPEQPWLLYCSEFPSHCGFINWKTQKHRPFGLASNAIFNSAGDVLLDTGRYDPVLDKQLSFEGYQSFWPDMASSSKRNLIFNKLPRADYITDHEILVRDDESGEVIDTIKRQVFPVRNLLAFDEDNLGFFTASFSETWLHGLDTSTLGFDHSAFPLNVLKSEVGNGWLAISGQDFTSVMRLDNSQTPKFFDYGVKDLAIVGNYLVTARDKAIYRYDMLSDVETQLYSFESPIHEMLVLDQKAEQIVVRLNYGVFALPHLDKKLALPFQGGSTKALTLGQDGKSFFVSGLSGYSKAYNPNINVIQQFDLSGQPFQEMEPEWGASQVMLATSNGQLWSGNKSGGLTIREVNSGLILESIVAHQGAIVDMVQLNEDTMVTASTDGAVKLWRLDIPNGKFRHNRLGLAYSVLVAPDIGKRQPRLKATIIVDGEGGHVISMADGYYSATPKALHNASFVNDDEIFDYARFDFWLNRPDLVLKRLGRVNNTSLTQWQKMVGYRQSRNPYRQKTFPRTFSDFNFTLKGPKKVVQKDEVELHYTLGTAAKRLHLLVNQVPVFGSKGKPLLNDDKRSVTLDLTPGTNRIKAFVTDDKGMPSETQYLTYYGKSKIKPELYVLAVGVSDYALDRLDLNFAGKDAEDLVQALGDTSQFKQVHSKIILDQNGTRENILKAREFIKEARAIDSVIVFFAGHGLLDSDDNYFFGTTDIDPDDPAAKGLAYAEMSGLLDGISARQKLMLMDTCYSGEVTEKYASIELPSGVSTRGLTFASESEVDISHSMLQKTFVDLRASTGTIVISAAGGREFALETEGVKNGIFTASFIKGLRQGDVDNDGQVTVSELRNFTYNEVNRLSAGAQKPTTRKHNLDVDFAIY